MRVVIPCVNYSDYLDLILPEWFRVLSPHAEIIVVTTQDDTATTKVCCKYPRIETRFTDAFYSLNAKFNKAGALDRSLLDTIEGGIVLCLDADVVPAKNSYLPTYHDIDSDTLYGCKRYEPGFEKICPPANLPFIKKRGRGDSPESCGGYFQLFRYNSKRNFGNYPTAATYDYDFAFKFPRAKTLDTISVAHLGERRVNWEGRVK